MSRPSDAREALIAEAIGDVGRMMRQLAAVAPQVEETRGALLQAKDDLREWLEGFESHVIALAESAKTTTLHHIATRTDEAARRLIERQRSEISEMVRGAFGRELDDKLSRMQAAVQQLIESQQRRWEDWLLYAAAVVLGSAATLVIQSKPWA